MITGPRALFYDSLLAAQFVHPLVIPLVIIGKIECGYDRLLEFEHALVLLAGVSLDGSRLLGALLNQDVNWLANL